MDSVDLMVSEHKNILRLCFVTRKVCYGIMKGNEINYEDFADIISFVRNYADAHHHGKEEKIFFKKMQDNLGKIAENLITHGMLVEHDLGRLHMSELENALQRVKDGDEESKVDVIANAISYTHLLNRHIKKEDDLIYPYGLKNLSNELIYEINSLTEKFEEEATVLETQQKYINMLEKLERKYL